MKALLNYNGQNWTDKDDEFYGEICEVSSVNVKSSAPNSINETTADELSELSSDAVDEETLKKMPELRPPELMPHGNVGTPTLVFLDLIQQCLLPHTLVKKLDLKFPRTRSKRLYDSVNYHYQSSPGSSSGISLSRNKFTAPKQKNKNIKMHHSKSKISHEKLSEPSEAEVPIVRASESYTVKQSFESKYSQKSVGQNSEATCSKDKNSKIQTESQTVGESVVEPKCAITETDRSDVKERKELFLIPQDPVPSKHSQIGNYVPATLRKNMKTSCSSSLGELTHTKEELTHKEKKAQAKADRKLTRQMMAEGIEEKMIAVEKNYQRASEEAAEEWNRHEASEDDPSNQERNKERLYEEEIEQPWEKGGPGVLFYTDAMFWQNKEGDFDEQTTDDLDVDFSAYDPDEGPGTSDMDMRDFIKIRQEQRFRSGYDKTDRFSIGIGKRIPGAQPSQGTKTKIGAFEQYSKGFGRKLMESQGWTDGEGLGSSRQGMAEALRGEGQRPYNKRGIGYVDEDPIHYGHTKKHSKQHVISTVYDDPHTSDPKEPLLQRSEPTTLKHRPEFVEAFQKKNKNL